MKLRIGSRVVVIKECEYRGYVGRINYAQGTVTTTDYSVVFDEKNFISPLGINEHNKTAMLFKEDEIIYIYDQNKCSELASNFEFISNYLNHDEIKEVIKNIISDRIANEFYQKMYGEEELETFNKSIQDGIVGKYVESVTGRSRFAELNDIFGREIDRLQKDEPSGVEFRDAVQKKLVSVMEEYIDNHKEYVAYVLKENMDSLVKKE